MNVPWIIIQSENIKMNQKVSSSSEVLNVTALKDSRLHFSGSYNIKSISYS